MVVEQNCTSDSDHEDPVILRTGQTQNGETEEVYEFAEVVPNSATEIKLFKRRWLQLVLFFACSTINNMQWYQYTVCGNIMRKYWGVSSLAIEWTSVIYMAVYLLLVYPATYVMERGGLRWTVLIGAGGTCVGAWIKVFSVSPDLFAVTFFGHTIVAISHIFLLTVPGRLAAYWFGPKEVAKATTIACYGLTAGSLTSSVFTTHSVRNHADIADIGDDLYKYFITIAIICTIVSGLVLPFFQNEPSLPPSITRALQKANRKTADNAEGIWAPVKRILANKSFVTICHSYSFLVNITAIMATVTNSLYLAHFENGEVEIGNLTILSIVTGFIVATLCAVILDKTKKFRLISTTLCYVTLLAQIAIAVSMVMEVKWLVFVSFGIWGFSVVGYSNVGLELCVETTYPEAEEVVFGVFSIATQVYGALMVLITGRTISMYGDKAGHACMIAFAALGAMSATFGKLDLRRSRAAEVAGYRNVKSQQLE